MLATFFTVTVWLIAGGLALSLFTGAMILYGALSTVVDLWNAGIKMLLGLFSYGFYDIPGVEDIIGGIHSFVVPVGVTLCVILCYIEFARGGFGLIEQKRIENVIRTVLKLALCCFVMGYWEAILAGVYTAGQELLLGLQGLGGAGPAPGGILSYNNLSLKVNHLTSFFGDAFGDSFEDFDFFNAMQAYIESAMDAGEDASLGEVLANAGLQWLGSPLDWLVMLVCCGILVLKPIKTLFDVVVSVAIRWARVLIHIVFAPLAITTFTCQETKDIGRRFALSFISISLELIIIALSLFMLPAFLNVFSELYTGSFSEILPGIFEDLPVVRWILGTFMISSVFSVLTSLLRGLDQFMERMLGLGGA